MTQSCDVAIIGGGFYGLYLAEYLSRCAGRVVLFEAEAGLMRRASYANQARVHNGYHYPRSILTATRSQVNFPRFVSEFGEAVDSTIETVYAVGKRFSKITAGQFYSTMRRISAPIRNAPKEIQSLFSPQYIESAFIAQEYVFNTSALCAIMTERLHRAAVDVRLSTTVTAVRPTAKGSVVVDFSSQQPAGSIVAGHVFCCGYAQLNSPGVGGGLSTVTLKHELTEMALVDVPDTLKGLGVTVMDGPFFSLMPFPARQLHTLSHVRYTPHSHWFDRVTDYKRAYHLLDGYPKQTAYPHMVRDAARFLPIIARCQYRDSLWEVKTLLPRSEVDDSRPILFRRDHGIANYHLVLGGKIDNVYDVADLIGTSFGWR